jgi:hypothetical protein
LIEAKAMNVALGVVVIGSVLVAFAIYAFFTASHL